MLREGHLKIVLASLLGSIFVNLLFILGVSVMSAGMNNREQIYDHRNAQILLFFIVTGVLSLLIPVSPRTVCFRVSNVIRHRYTP
jgi:Ca2+:H+ antiporter